MRKIERKLCADLLRTAEVRRAACVRLREAIEAAITLSAPDAFSELSAARLAARNAGRALKLALRRWKDFVIRGAVPRNLE